MKILSRFIGKAFSPVGRKKSSIIRVNHAGELCAKYIYLGQLSVIKEKKIEEMLDHELKHLSYFEKKAMKEGSRLSVLTPLCVTAGFIAGGLTAMAGRRYAMALTMGVENVIQEHYKEQMEELKTLSVMDEELKNKIKEFHDDEEEHGEYAAEEGAKDVNQKFVKITEKLTKLMVKVAKKI